MRFGAPAAEWYPPSWRATCARPGSASSLCSRSSSQRPRAPSCRCRRSRCRPWRPRPCRCPRSRCRRRPLRRRRRRRCPRRSVPSTPGVTASRAAERSGAPLPSGRAAVRRRAGAAARLGNAVIAGADPAPAPAGRWRSGRRRSRGTAPARGPRPVGRRRPGPPSRAASPTASAPPGAGPPAAPTGGCARPSSAPGLPLLLPRRQRRVLTLRAGVGPARPASRSRVADRLGLSVRRSGVRSTAACARCERRRGRLRLRERVPSRIRPRTSCCRPDAGARYACAASRRAALGSGRSTGGERRRTVHVGRRVRGAGAVSRGRRATRAAPAHSPDLPGAGSSDGLVLLALLGMTVGLALLVTRRTSRRAEPPRPGRPLRSARARR